MRQPASLTLHLRPSWRVVSLIGLWYAATAAIAWTLPWSMFWSLMCTIACSALAVHEARRTGLRLGAKAWQAFRVNEHRAIQVRLGDGSLMIGRLRPTTYVGTSVVVLHVKRDTLPGLRTALVVADMVGSDEFRQLKVLLRLSLEPSPAVARAAVGPPTGASVE